MASTRFFLTLLLLGMIGIYHVQAIPQKGLGGKSARTDEEPEPEPEPEPEDICTKWNGSYICGNQKYEMPNAEGTSDSASCEIASTKYLTDLTPVTNKFSAGDKMSFYAYMNHDPSCGGANIHCDRYKKGPNGLWAPVPDSSQTWTTNGAGVAASCGQEIIPEQDISCYVCRGVYGAESTHINDGKCFCIKTM